MAVTEQLQFPSAGSPVTDDVAICSMMHMLSKHGGMPRMHAYIVNYYICVKPRIASSVL